MVAVLWVVIVRITNLSKHTVRHTLQRTRAIYSITVRNNEKLLAVFHFPVCFLTLLTRIIQQILILPSSNSVVEDIAFGFVRRLTAIGCRPFAKLRNFTPKNCDMMVHLTRSKR
jgi:hypothetical protein